MGFTGGGQVVQAPRAKAPTQGLLASAASPEPQDLVDGHWKNGIAYQPRGCAQGQSIDVCDISTELGRTTNPNAVEWLPYGLIARYVCTTFSYREDREEIVRDLLIMDTERQIAAELWTGDLSNASGSPNTWLADSHNVVELTASAVGLVHGLACLDNYLLRHNGGQQGMIHCTGQVFDHWASFRLFRWVGNTVLSPLGNLVVASPGYPGTDPSGAIDDNNVWAYATDMVRVWLDDQIEVIDPIIGTNRQDNDIESTATRVGLAEWENCRHAGVQLAITLCGDEGS